MILSKVFKDCPALVKSRRVCCGNAELITAPHEIEDFGARKSLIFCASIADFTSNILHAQESKAFCAPKRSTFLCESDVLLLRLQGPQNWKFWGTRNLFLCAFPLNLTLSYSITITSTQLKVSDRYIKNKHLHICMKHIVKYGIFVLLLGILIISGCIRIESTTENQDPKENTVIDTDNQVVENNEDSSVDFGSLYNIMQEIKYETDPLKFAELQTQLDLQLKPYVQPYLDEGCELNTEGNVFCPEDSQFYLNNDFNCYGALTLRPEALAFGFPLFNCLVRGTNDAPDYDYFYCKGGRLHTCQSYVIYSRALRPDNSGADSLSVFAQLNNNVQLLKLLDAKKIDSKEKAMAFVLLTLDVSKDLVVDGKKIKEGTSVKEGDHYVVTVYAMDKNLGCYDTVNYMELRYSVAYNGDLELIPDGDYVGKIVYTKKLPGTICVD